MATDPAKSLTKLHDEITSACSDWDKKYLDYKKLFEAMKLQAQKKNVKPPASALDKLSVNAEKVRVEILNAKQAIAITEPRVADTIAKMKKLLEDLYDITADLV